MNFLQRVDRIWEAIEKGILSITTILMSIMLVSNALSRYFFNKSWPFTEEIGTMGIIILTFMGLGYAARQHMHIEMSGVYDLLPPKFKYALDLIINFGSFLVLLFCAYISFQYVQHLHNIGQVSTILRLPLYLTMAVIPLGFLIASIRFITNFITGLKFDPKKYEKVAEEKLTGGV